MKYKTSQISLRPRLRRLRNVPNEGFSFALEFLERFVHSQGDPRAPDVKFCFSVTYNKRVEAP